MNRRSFLGFVYRPRDSSTQLLLHFEGDNGGRVFTDSSPYARTVNYSGTSVYTSTGTGSKFGTGYLTSNVGNFLYCSSIAIAKQPFCIEGWFKAGSFSTYNCFFGYGGNLATTHGFCVYYNNGPQVWTESLGAVITAAALSVNVWHHIAVVGDGGADGSRHIQLYVDGVLKGTCAIDYNWTNTVYIVANGSATNQGLLGYTDEFRVSVGARRYSGDFTPSTIPFTV